MTTPEEKYYECETFWTEGMVEDPMNVTRIERTAAMIPRGMASVADIGCGNGRLLAYLQTHRADIGRLLGVERSAAALGFVKAEHVQGSVDALPLADRSQECVTCCEVIEHLPNGVFPKALAELTRVADRYLLITVPNAENLNDNSTQCPQCRSVFNADLHLRSFDRSTMTILVRDHGFELCDVQTFVPFERYVGALRYYQFLTRDKFKSPVCPVCAYENVGYSPPSFDATSTFERRGSAGSKLKNAMKRFWPKTKHPGFWIAGLYRRNT